MRHFIRFSYLLFTCFLIKTSVAQTNTDSLFLAAIDQAKNKKYTESVSNCRKVLAVHPERTDVLVYLGNVYAWKGDFDSSKQYIKQALSINIKDKDSYTALLNVLLWNNEYESLLVAAKQAQENGYDNHYDLMLKKMTAYSKLKQYEAAVLLYEDSTNTTFRDSADAFNLYKEVKLLSKKNIIGVYYFLDFFNEFAPQHLSSLEYTLNLPNQTFSFRTNYAYKFETSGIQVEADYYRIFRKNYLYLNYGLGIDNVIFPLHRAGAEFFFVENSFETSLGGRFLNFSNDNIFIGTVSIGKYFGNSWLSVRPYYAVRSANGEGSISLAGNYRLYGINKFNFWGLEFGYGNTPDDRNIQQENGSNLYLQSFRLKMEKNLTIGTTTELRLVAGYSYEEYYTDLFRNRYLIELHYKFRMK